MSFQCIKNLASVYLPLTSEKFSLVFDKNNDGSLSADEIKEEGRLKLVYSYVMSPASIRTAYRNAMDDNFREIFRKDLVDLKNCHILETSTQQVLEETILKREFAPDHYYATAGIESATKIIDDTVRSKNGSPDAVDHLTEYELGLRTALNYRTSIEESKPWNLEAKFGLVSGYNRSERNQGQGAAINYFYNIHPLASLSFFTSDRNPKASQYRLGVDVDWQRFFEIPVDSRESALKLGGTLMVQNIPLLGHQLALSIKPNWELIHYTDSDDSSPTRLSDSVSINSVATYYMGALNLLVSHVFEKNNITAHLEHIDTEEHKASLTAKWALPDSALFLILGGGYLAGHSQKLGVKSEKIAKTNGAITLIGIFSFSKYFGFDVGSLVELTDSTGDIQGFYPLWLGTLGLSLYPLERPKDLRIRSSLSAQVHDFDLNVAQSRQRYHGSVSLTTEPFEWLRTSANASVVIDNIENFNESHRIIQQYGLNLTLRWPTWNHLRFDLSANFNPQIIKTPIAITERKALDASAMLYVDAYPW